MTFKERKKERKPATLENKPLNTATANPDLISAWLIAQERRYLGIISKDRGWAEAWRGRDQLPSKHPRDSPRCHLCIFRMTRQGIVIGFMMK